MGLCIYDKIGLSSSFKDPIEASQHVKAHTQHRHTDKDIMNNVSIPTKEVVSPNPVHICIMVQKYERHVGKLCHTKCNAEHKNVL